MALRYDDPRRQRLIRKVMNMSPEQRAVINTAALGRMFAQEDAHKMLQVMDLAQRRREFEARHQLAQKGFGLEEKGYKFAKKERGTANIFAGLGGGLGAATGWMDLVEKQKLVNRLNLLTRRYAGLLGGGI